MFLIYTSFIRPDLAVSHSEPVNLGAPSLARTLRQDIAEQIGLHRLTKEEGRMAKQVITVDGEDRVVREDSAKAFRGVHWALLSVGAFILIAAIIFFGGFLKMASDGGVQTSPADRGGAASQSN